MAEIKVNPDDAQHAIAGFDDIAADYVDVEQSASDMESAVYGDWSGDAANACKETFAKIEECLEQLGQEVVVHAGIVSAAVATFLEQDQCIAGGYGAGGSGGGTF